MGKVNWNKVAMGIDALMVAGSMWGANKNRKEIEKLISDGNDLLQKAEVSLCNQQEITNKSLERLGKLKLDMYNTTIETFSELVYRFKNREFSLNKIKNIYYKLIYRYNIKKIKSDVEYSKWVKNNIRNGVNFGTASARLVYGMTAAFGKTPDGRKIKELSGDEKKRATLELIGSGNARQGKIILAGRMICDSVASTAYMTYSSSQKDLEKVKKEYEEAKIEAARIETFTVKLSRVKEKSLETIDVIYECGKRLDDCSKKIQEIYNKYYEEESNTFFNRMRSKLGLEIKVDCKKRLSGIEKDLVYLYFNEGDMLYQMLKKPILDKNNNIDQNLNKSLEDLKDMFYVEEVDL